MAPTPVTALLHAVAVVNAGAFAIIRLTYYSFGVEFLRGTWVQDAAMAIAMFTIVYGCSRAVKESHIKRRLAWSTVSNLSYILYGIATLTTFGLVAAMAHMVFHAVLKIILFFGVGYGAYYSTADMPIPMVADCADYETYSSGKFIPGIMGTLFSLVD